MMEIAKGARKRSTPFARIEDAVEAVRAGRMVIVVDDEDRENEGDLTIAAEKVTPEVINFMARYGRGLVCLSMIPERVGVSTERVRMKMPCTLDLHYVTSRK